MNILFEVRLVTFSKVKYSGHWYLCVYCLAWGHEKYNYFSMSKYLKIYILISINPDKIYKWNWLQKSNTAPTILANFCKVPNDLGYACLHFWSLWWLKKITSKMSNVRNFSLFPLFSAELCKHYLPTISNCWSLTVWLRFFCADWVWLRLGLGDL